MIVFETHMSSTNETAITARNDFRENENVADAVALL